MPTTVVTADVMNYSAGAVETRNSTSPPSGKSFYNYTCRLQPKVEDGLAKRLAQGVSPEQIYNEDFLYSVKLRIPVWIFAFLSLYMAIMLSVNAAKKVPTNQRQEKHANDLKHARLSVAWFTAAALLYCGFSLFLEPLGVDCSWHGKTENALYWLNISVVYVVLWLRQRLIFKQPNLSHLTSRLTSFLSYATIFMVVALPLINTVIFSTFCVFCRHPILKTCMIGKMIGSRYIHVAGEYIVPTLLPITLLALFSYPILRHHLQLDKALRGQRPVIRILYRISFLTFVCLVTDIAAVTCNVMCQPNISFITRRMSLFTNLACMVASFTDCRGVLFPRKREKRPEVAHASSVPPTYSVAAKVPTYLP